VLRVLSLVQDFTGEQETQNDSFKHKLSKLQQEIDSKFELFKAFKSHEDLVAKVENVEWMLSKYESRFRENERNIETKLDAYHSHFQTVTDKHVKAVDQLQEKIKVLQYGINTQRRVILAGQVNDSQVRRDRNTTMLPSKVNEQSYSPESQIRTRRLQRESDSTGEIGRSKLQSLSE